MKNKNSRIEIRLPENIKNNFQDYAKKNNTTMSAILLAYILQILEKGSNKNGILD